MIEQYFVAIRGFVDLMDDRARGMTQQQYADTSWECDIENAGGEFADLIADMLTWFDERNLRGGSDYKPAVQITSTKLNPNGGTFLNGKGGVNFSDHDTALLFKLTFGGAA